MIKWALFDLDGTLLPMDQDVFAKAYFKSMCTKMAPYGYEPDKLVKAIWDGTYSMVKNDGSVTNEEAFWTRFKQIYSDEAIKDKPTIDNYYETGFKSVKDVCGYTETSNKIVKLLKSKGIKCILATNPVFPRTATMERISWAGLDYTDFELITTYENSCYSKPNPKYYSWILDTFKIDPSECIMIGNDVAEDILPTKSLQIKSYLVTDDLINKTDHSIDEFDHYTRDELFEHLKNTL